MALKYIGKGKHITGVPASDLDDETLATLAVQVSVSDLIASGLYKAPAKTKMSKVIKDDK